MMVKIFSFGFVLLEVVLLLILETVDCDVESYYIINCGQNIQETPQYNPTAAKISLKNEQNDNEFYQINEYINLLFTCLYVEYLQPHPILSVPSS